MTKSLSDISDAMQDVDFCMLVTKTEDGSLGGRPMSNNGEVAYEGTSWFFTYDDARMVEDIRRDAAVGLTYRTTGRIKQLVGAPGLFIHVEGIANVIDDKARFAEHWDASLDRWFEQGVDTPGLRLIEVRAKRIHYWDGEDEGEVSLGEKEVWTQGP